MKTSYPVQWFFGLFSRISPFFVKQDQQLIVLTAFHGDGFRGNTKAIFLELLSHPYLKPVWLSRNKAIISAIKKEFGDETAALTHSWMGLNQLAACKALLMTHGTSDYPFMYLPRRAARIQTYHGLPTKRGEYMRPKQDKRPNFMHRRLLEYRFKPITHFLSSSKHVSEIFSERFGIPLQTFFETGYPAYDKLFHADKNQSVFFEKLIPEFDKDARFILYAPTYRRLAKTQWFPFSDKNLRELGTYLEEKNLWMGIRPHPNDTFDFKSLKQFSKRFVLVAQHIVEEIEPLIVHSDVIVTDYSSIFIEGLLRDIPPIFIPYDRSYYERGIPYDYDEMTPGPLVSTQKEFLNALNDAITKPESYADKRKMVKNYFFTHPTGTATKNVIHLLEQIASD
jgi:CDP-glycerol glycerophosphotransferase